MLIKFTTKRSSLYRLKNLCIKKCKDQRDVAFIFKEKKFPETFSVVKKKKKTFTKWNLWKRSQAWNFDHTISRKSPLGRVSFAVPQLPRTSPDAFPFLFSKFLFIFHLNPPLQRLSLNIINHWSFVRKGRVSGTSFPVFSGYCSS